MAYYDLYTKWLNSPALGDEGRAELKALEGNDKEIEYLLDLFETTTAGTGLMHEGFHVDDPTVFTRPWFTWPDSLFCEFVNKCMDEGIV